MSEANIERNEAILRAVANGGSYARVAHQYGISRQRVEQIVLKEGPQVIAKKRFDYAQKVSAICAEMAAGKKMKEVAAKFGVSQPGISRIWNRNATEAQFLDRAIVVANRRTEAKTKNRRQYCARQRAAHFLLACEAERRGLTAAETAREIVKENKLDAEGRA